MVVFAQAAQHWTEAPTHDAGHSLDVGWSRIRWHRIVGHEPPALQRDERHQNPRLGRQAGERGGEVNFLRLDVIAHVGAHDPFDGGFVQRALLGNQVLKSHSHLQYTHTLIHAYTKIKEGT